MVNNEATEEFLKELDLTEEEIESYTGVLKGSQRCLTGAHGLSRGIH